MARILGLPVGGEITRGSLAVTAITFKARDYQLQAIRHLLRKPFSGLFMDPGTGKTACILAAYHVLKKKGMVDKMLVVAPINPAYNTWPAEIEEWHFPYSWKILHGYKKEQRLHEEADIYIINYEGLAWLAKQKGWAFDWLVLDESSKVRNTRSQRFRLLKQLLKRFKRRSILTGTPVPNGLINLFGQIFCLDHGASLGRYITHYRREHFYQTGYGGYTWELQNGHDKLIHKAVKPLVFRVSEDELDLPKKFNPPIYLTMDKQAMTQYKRFEADFVLQVEDNLITAANAAVLSQKLRQVANGGIYNGSGVEDKRIERPYTNIHMEKANAIVDLSAELAGKPLLVGYEFRHDMYRLKEQLGDVPHVGGGMRQSLKNQLFSEFNEGKHPVLLGQIESMSLGLNLQKACSHVAIHSLPWDLEAYIQFIRRVYRSGQKNRTYIYHLIMRDTIDEVVMRVLRTKGATQAKLLTSLKTTLRRRS